MSYDTVPEQTDGPSAFKEDGFYLQFSREESFLSQEHRKLARHFYKIAFIKKDMRGQKYLIRFGGCDYNILGDATLKHLKSELPNWYQYRDVIEKSFGKNCGGTCSQEPGYAEPGYPEPGHPEPAHAEPGHPEPGHAEPGHPDPIENFRDFYDLNVRGCRCSFYRGVICTCHGEGVDCDCLSHRNRMGSRTPGEELLGQCKLVDFLGITDPTDPVQTGKELFKLDFRAFLYLGGYVEISEWTSPIKDEYSQSSMISEDDGGSSREVPSDYTPICTKVVNPRKFLTKELIKDDDENRFDDFVKKVDLYLEVFNDLDESCRFCGTKDCNELYKDFLDQVETSRLCDVCLSQGIGQLLYQTYYSCRECPCYDLCEKCFTSNNYNHGHIFGKNTLLKKNGEMEYTYTMVGYASSIQVNNQYYIQKSRHEDGTMLRKAMCSYSSFKDLEFFYYFPIDDTEEEVHEDCQLALNNWKNLLIRAKKLYLVD